MEFKATSKDEAEDISLLEERVGNAIDKLLFVRDTTVQCTSA